MARTPLWLSQRNPAGAPGPLGGSLAERLRLDVVDVKGPAAPARVYSGAFAGMRPRSVGYMAPGARRTYRFVATFPAADDGSDNAYAGSSASVGYVWTGVEGPPPAGADTAPPRLRLSFPRIQRVLTIRRMLVRALCSEPCRIDMRGSVRVRGARAAVRAIRGRGLRAGRPARLVVRIPRRGMSVLKRSLTARRAVRLHLSIVARDGAGNRALARRIVRLRARRALVVRQAGGERGVEARVLPSTRGG